MKNRYTELIREMVSVPIGDYYVRPFEIFGGTSSPMSVIVGERPATPVKTTELSLTDYVASLDGTNEDALMIVSGHSLSKSRKKILEFKDYLIKEKLGPVWVMNVNPVPCEAGIQTDQFVNVFTQSLEIARPQFIVIHGDNVFPVLNSLKSWARMKWESPAIHGGYISDQLPTCHLATFTSPAAKNGYVLVTRHFSRFQYKEIELLKSTLGSLNN